MSQIKELRYVRQTHGESTTDNSVGARALGRPEKFTLNHILEPDHKLIAPALLDVPNRSFRTEPGSTSLPPLRLTHPSRRPNTQLEVTQKGPFPILPVPILRHRHTPG